MTPEIEIRLAEEGDLDFVLEAQADPEVAPNIGFGPRERHLAAIEGEGEELLIVTAGGRPVGFVLLTDLTGSNRNLEIHTIVISERGEGFGQAALRLVLDRGFGHHGAHRMWLDAIGGNERARHVYEKIGFTYEGEWREAWQTAEGAWLPMIFLGMLDREWAEIRAAS